MRCSEARLSMKLFVLAAVVLVALSLVAGAHGQSYGGFASNGGPIQFPPAPTSAEMSSVVIGGSGFGFVPPQAGGGRGFNSGSRYRGGSSFGGSSFGGSSFGGGGGYRSSFGGPRFGGFDGYRGFGGLGLRGVSGHGGFFNHW